MRKPSTKARAVLKAKAAKQKESTKEDTSELRLKQIRATMCLEKGGHQFEDLSRRIIGAAIAVHTDLGPGFPESVYEEALKVQMCLQEIGFESQKEIAVEYLGVEVGRHRLDLVVEDTIIVELKVVTELADIHFAQLRSYLKATDLQVGLLLNFAKPTLEVKRVVN